MSELVNAIGWTLVHFLWEGALIAFVLALILAVCSRAKTRHGAACLAMLAMLVAFGVTLAVSIPTGEDQLPRVQAMPRVAELSGSGEMTGRSLEILARIDVALPWIVAFWIAGCLAIGSYRLTGWFSAQRMRKRGVCAAPPAWQERLIQLASHVGVLQPLVLLESSLAEVPMVIGLFRPAILVPVGLLAGLPPQHVEAILLHELAHIRRWDYLFNLIQTAVESLLFYHPAVWWISGLIRAEREHCCDDAVVALQGDVRAYADALLTLEESRWARREPALAVTGGPLMNRIRRLLNQPEEPRTAAALVPSMSVLLSMFCLFAVAQQTKPDTPYQKWLDEDAVYIITNEERAEFNRLETESAREEFVRQFWLQRDPTPGTAENEVKEEHYRRIAYANERFWASKPGWKTDRGRIYIMFGPPDEIENTPGRECWRYRYIEGIGNDVVLEFIDPAHSGEFRLASPFHDI